MFSETLLLNRCASPVSIEFHSVKRWDIFIGSEMRQSQFPPTRYASLVSATRKELYKPRKSWAHSLTLRRESRHFDRPPTLRRHRCAIQIRESSPSRRPPLSRQPRFWSCRQALDARSEVPTFEVHPAVGGFMDGEICGENQAEDGRGTNDFR
jgi:hypothetical protein